jgi:hypothetical protein
MIFAPYAHILFGRFIHEQSTQCYHPTCVEDFR